MSTPSHLRRLQILLGILCLACPLASVAAPETHDGLMLRIAVGPGSLKASTDHLPVTGTDAADRSPGRLEGSGSAFVISIGGSITPNLVLHAELMGVGAQEPRVYQGGDQGRLKKTDLTASAAGIGLTWYTTETNIFVTGALMTMSLLAHEDGGREIELANKGTAGRFALGKEWWVSENWGLGFAGTALIGHTRLVDRRTRGPDWRVTSYGLMFSATWH